jgi:hypothetical protein
MTHSTTISITHSNSRANFFAVMTHLAQMHSSCVVIGRSFQFSCCNHDEATAISLPYQTEQRLHCYN